MCFEEFDSSGIYHDRDLGVSIRVIYNEEANHYEATSSDVLGVTAIAFDRHAALRSWIKKYNTTWSQFKINVLKRRVKLTFEDRNQDLTEVILDALTDLGEFAAKARFQEKVEQAFCEDTDVDYDAPLRDRKRVDLHAYWSVTLFLVSVASACYIVDMIRSLFR